MSTTLSLNFSTLLNGFPFLTSVLSVGQDWGLTFSIGSLTDSSTCVGDSTLPSSDYPRVLQTFSLIGKVDLIDSETPSTCDRGSLPILTLVDPSVPSTSLRKGDVLTGFVYTSYPLVSVQTPWPPTRSISIPSFTFPVSYRREGTYSSSISFKIVRYVILERVNPLKDLIKVGGSFLFLKKSPHTSWYPVSSPSAEC